MVNVMDEYVSFSKKCFHKYLKMILDKYYSKEVCERFIDTYFDVKYSNYCDEESVKLSLDRKINRAIQKTASSYRESNPDMKEEIGYTESFLPYLKNLDQLYLLESQKKTINEISDLRSKLLKIDDNKFINDFSSLLRVDIKKRKEFLNSFDSDTFSLKLKALDKSKSLLKATLNNKIKFPELYSEDAILKVSEKDSVSEDLTSITLLQVSALIINNIISEDFLKVYCVYIPTSLFDKKTKVNRVFGIIDNSYIQDHLDIVVSYECFNKYQGSIMELMRKGFVFGIYLDDSFEYCSDNIEYLELFDKILLNSSKYYYKDMKNNGKIKSRIISVDEVK